jgi:signal transduction histidine kinase/FixJ family two-component response regulator
MTQPIRILHLDDNSDNSRLIRTKLESSGIAGELIHVDNRADFIAALERGGVDLILADGSTSQLDGLAALKITRENHSEIPFIFVTGSFHQKRAVEFLRAGAVDHVLKPGLLRLAPAIFRALREVELLRERKRAEGRLTAIQDNYRLMSSTFDLGEILPGLLKKIDACFPGAGGYIALLDVETGQIQPCACRGINETEWRESLASADDSLESRVAKSNQTRLIRSLQDNDELSASPFYQKSGFTSWLGIPFGARGEAAGVLAVLTRDRHDFTESEIDCAATLARQAGLAVANARIYSSNKQLARDLLSSESHVGKLVAGLIHAHDEEARRIARVLHDESQQLLASVYLSLDEIAASAPPEYAKRFEHTKKLLDQVEDRLRDLSHELYPTALDDLGLLPSLEFLADQIGKRKGIRITVESHLNGRLSPLLELTLYRVVQEALNNTARHSQASQADIRLLENPEFIRCSIKDNGAGFDVQSLTKVGTGKKIASGLSGMRERVAAIAGTLQIISSPGGGTNIVIQLPRGRN